MLKNYLKVAFRNIKRHKGYAFLNITGLAIGMAACVIIFLWIQTEMNFDRFHENADRIYRLIAEANMGNYSKAPVSPNPAGPAMVREFPEVLQYVRLTRPRPLTLIIPFQTGEFSCRAVTPDAIHEY